MNTKDNELIKALQDIAQNRGNTCCSRLLCAERAQRALRADSMNATPPAPTQNTAQGFEATPRDWTYFVGNANGRGLVRIEVNGTGLHIASMPRGKKSEERAALICRAVNAHDELVAALKPFASFAKQFEKVKDGTSVHPMINVSRIRDAVAALKKATGETK